MRPEYVKGVALGASIFLSAALLSAQQSASPELGRNANGSLEATITASSLRVDGVTPGGEVAYLGANHEEVRESWGSLRSYSGVLTDDDSDGEVEFAPESGISQASVWVVVDLTSGEVVGVTPHRFTKTVPEEIALEVSSTGTVISADRQDLELLLHRPGLGVWFGKGVDGGQGDESLHADGKLRVDLSVFQSLGRGGPPPPSALRPGDRLLAVDLTRLDSITVSFQ